MSEPVVHRSSPLPVLPHASLEWTLVDSWTRRLAACGSSVCVVLALALQGSCSGSVHSTCPLSIFVHIVGPSREKCRSEPAIMRRVVRSCLFGYVVVEISC